ncbi:MAG: tRNA (guanosine(46)-N7)-methyltransferase TrmB [Oscillospiraceae bacterium]
MRMRLKKWAIPELLSCNFYVQQPTNQIGQWRQLFKNPTQKLYVELGCGKGGFISKLASMTDDVNFIAIDMISNMLGMTKRACENEYSLLNKKTDNILLTIVNIEQASNVFNANDQIDRIYINFCNPWPKPKHYKKRLTHERQLNQYKTFLNKTGEIHFKTDDDLLFNHSLEYFKNCGFQCIYFTRDLHNSDYKNNIMTEHENFFTTQGIKIKFGIFKVI